MGLKAFDVFVNCPFDAPFKPIFHAIIFTTTRSGFRPRCALEADNSADNRLDKICAIIKECRYGIHDVSRTERDGTPPLPRFNMPFELGLFLGARRYGGKSQRSKTCVIFDREPYRYQRFISDIAGQDIHAHGGDVANLIRELAAWFRTQAVGMIIPGGNAISAEYSAFETLLPAICAARHLAVDELTYGDFNEVVTEYVATLTRA